MTAAILISLCTVLQNMKYTSMFSKARFTMLEIHPSLPYPRVLTQDEYNNGPDGNVCGIGLLIYLHNTPEPNVDIKESWYGYANRSLPDLTLEQFQYLFDPNMRSLDNTIEGMIFRLQAVIHDLKH